MKGIRNSIGGKTKSLSASLLDKVTIVLTGSHVVYCYYDHVLTFRDNTGSLDNIMREVYTETERIDQNGHKATYATTPGRVEESRGQIRQGTQVQG